MLRNAIVASGALLVFPFHSFAYPMVCIIFLCFFCTSIYDRLPFGRQEKGVPESILSIFELLEQMFSPCDGMPEQCGRSQHLIVSIFLSWRINKYILMPYTQTRLPYPVANKYGLHITHAARTDHGCSRTKGLSMLHTTLVLFSFPIFHSYLLCIDIACVFFFSFCFGCIVLLRYVAFYVF